jgi:hypothetical protein
MVAAFSIEPTVSLGDLSQAVAVVVAALAILTELRRARQDRDVQQRRESAEHRWRQANAARELLTDIHDHPHAAAAVRMLDWGEKWQHYGLPSGLRASINLAVAKTALDDAMSEDESYLYVRECFDWLLYYFDRLGQYVESDFVLLEDVRPVLRPYAIAIHNAGLACSELAAQRQYVFLEAFLYRLRGETADSPIAAA